MSESGRDALHVVFSMDCLPAGEVGEVRGPANWQDAARSPVAFAETLAALGLGATVFIAPEALGRMAGAVQKLQDAGCELGILCHPQLAGQQACLGSYSYDRQMQIVRASLDAWSQAMGRLPQAFRPGFFSANDYTFHVLCMLGLRQGSCSLPGRIDNEQCSMWFGSYPFPHHTDPLDRSAKGSMEFFEVPVTSDFAAASFNSQDTFTPPCLRIEEPQVHEYARDLIERQLAGMDDEGLSTKTVHLVTSNLVGWGGADDPHIDRLRNLCSMLGELADRRGLDLQWTSLAELHELADREYPQLMDEDLADGLS